MKRALFVGLGGIGQRHLRNLRALLGDSVEVVAYRTRRLSQVISPTLDIEPGQDVETKYGVRSTSDLDQALSFQPDAAFICNPSSLHVPVALAAARAGCHVFLEKPISHNLDGIAELEQELAKRGRAGFVGFQLRFHPLIQRAKALVERDAIGRILMFRAEVCEYLPGFHRYEDYRQMYASRRDLGGGVILSQIHETDLMCDFLGLPTRVFAMGGHLSSLEVDVDDVANLSMEFDTPRGRAIGSLYEDYLQRPPSRGFTILGDAGKIVVSLTAGTLHAYGADGAALDQLTLEGFDRNQMFLDQLAHFVRCTRGEEQPRVSIYDGTKSLQVALAALQSIETGLPVALEARARASE
jgi:predicted dehydrogenase